jgi:hypothetical protein
MLKVFAAREISGKGTIAQAVASILRVPDMPWRQAGLD